MILIMENVPSASYGWQGTAIASVASPMWQHPHISCNGTNRCFTPGSDMTGCSASYIEARCDYPYINGEKAPDLYPGLSASMGCWWSNGYCAPPPAGACGYLIYEDDQEWI